MTGDPSLRILLQHSNRLFCELLAEHLMRDPAVAIVGTAVLRQELVELCVLRNPAVVVYEADAPDSDQLIALPGRGDRQIRLVGLHVAPPAVNAAQAGEDGRTTLVSYESGLRNLLNVLKHPDRPATAVCDRTDVERLTDRQQQVLHLIGAGYTPQEVADALGISLRTVENHKQQIYAKLNVHSQAHAVANAVRAGMTTAGAVVSRRVLPPWGQQISLTPREREILRSIGFGRTTKQTAAELGISARTVENLQGNLFRKLRVHSRTAALVVAHDLWLIDD
jgi:DNA-binding CsgD family transcriptional regulator